VTDEHRTEIDNSLLSVEVFIGERHVQSAAQEEPNRVLEPQSFGERARRPDEQLGRIQKPLHGSRIRPRACAPAHRSRHPYPPLAPPE
jgi:hypothetical protein